MFGDKGGVYGIGALTRQGSYITVIRSRTGDMGITLTAEVFAVGKWLSNVCIEK